MVAIVAVLLLGAVALAIGVVYVRTGVRRVVRCPDTGGIAQVETRPLDEVLHRLFPDSGFRIERCTRWPEQGGCDAACLRQIEADPVECQLRTIVKKWYEGRSCSLCRQPILVSNVFEGTCAVMAPDGRTRDWSDLTDEELAKVLTLYEPLCWNCHLDATFKRVVPRVHPTAS